MTRGMPELITTLPMRNLPKHDRYRTAYKRFDYFWGLGVEHETYIMTSKTKTITTFEGAMKAERYSVDYYTAYKKEVLASALADVIEGRGGSLTAPILMNGHSLTHCDLYGEHMTSYTKDPKPNPKYAGKTLFAWMCEYSAWMRSEINRSFMWDGDTIEFMTQRFYRATIDDVMLELKDVEARFVYELQKLPKKGVIETHGPLRLAGPRNEPWASYMTNPKNMAMFNNGTIHINVTLPTRLGFSKKPLWPADFLEKHRRLARLIQWFEPLWIAAYGSGDPFATGLSGKQFAAGSQRLAVSRYIGIGTFDTGTMPSGKILQVQKSELGPMPWYDWLHTRTAYAPLNVVGLDINYNKHWAHGLEIRFLDQLPMDSLRTVMEQLVILMDIALEGRPIPDPRLSAEWSSMAGSALYHGIYWNVDPSEMRALCEALDVKESPKEPLGVVDAIMWIFERLESRRGYCCDHMLNGVTPVDCCLP